MAALAAVPWPAGASATIVGVAGTVTSLAAMALRLATYDPARVHGYDLSVEALDAEIARLRASKQASASASSASTRAAPTSSSRAR